MIDPVLLLSQSHGEGRVTFRALKSAGFFTLAAVAETQLQVLADRAHLSTSTARRLQAGAAEMIGQGLDKRFRAPVPRRGRRRGAPTPPPPDRPGDGHGALGKGISLEEAALLGQGTPSRHPHRRVPAEQPVVSRERGEHRVVAGEHPADSLSEAPEAASRPAVPRVAPDPPALTLSREQLVSRAMSQDEMHAAARGTGAALKTGTPRDRRPPGSFWGFG